MPRGDQRTSVDTTRRGSVSFPPPGPSARDATPTERGDHAPRGVGPGRPAVASPIQILGGAREDVNQFPIQLAKVQRPSLRPETLRRDRLLDWLHAKIHSRVVLLTAEAGYGKTTLLADFSRRTRMRTLWYRLDEQDRDWVSVMHHLVAAGRVLDGGFAPATGGLLREMGPGGPDRDAIIDTFIRELFELGIEGAVVIIDDYHVVDESAEIRHVMRRLIARAPERMTFVFAGRRHPSIPLARLRALGEVVELTAQDLRFDGFETEQLFRETYGRPLEPDVLAELGSRTEGWAASLQLVQTALGDRSSGEIRTFVRGLTGAHGDLYDYLAEEVVGEQDERMQEFLMRTSILQVVDPERVGVVAALDHDAAQGCIELAERLGLLSRHGTAAHFVHRYHPLVRDFLQDRLRREIGATGVIELHRQVATWADGSDWRLAAYHYGAAGDLTDVHRVLTSAIQTIMSTGEYELAEGLINAYTAADRSAVYELVRSRMAWLRGDLDEVARRAASAAAQKGGVSVDLVLAIEFNSMALAFMSGQVDEALVMARELASRPIEGPLAGIPLATQLTAEVSVNRNIREYMAVLEDLLDHQRSPNSTHFFGITNLNLANAARSAGEQALSQRYVDAAIKALERSSKGHELGSAKQVRAWLLAYAGDYEESAREFVESTHTQNMLSRAEGMVEWADAEALFGDANEAMRILDECLGNLDGLESYADNWRVVRALGLVRLGALEDARELLRVRPIDAWSVENAHKARKLVLLAGIETLLLGRRARAQADEALAFAIGQDAHLWARFARVVRLGTLGDADAARELRELLARDPAMVSAAAEWAVVGIHLLNSAALDQLRGEIRRRPARWRGALRATTAAEQTARAMLAAEALDEIGETEDVLLLRQLARRLKGRGVDPRLGKRLALRLASRVFVEDQGRVELRIGDTLLPGTAMRRKVLALLCFLLTRPQFSAPRDAVLDAMWPDLEPEVAVNSLNQTVYFLRRVFEDPYAEDLSPGYVHHASDVLWLDPELISSRSAKCAHILASIGEKPDPDEVRGLITAYRGRFALDFAYEPWAEAYRESLHAAYLEVAERSIRADTATGHFDRGIQVARRVIAIDPDADQLEASLLRLYRLAGAHSAAAEQYEHYAAVLRRDLGVEPPSLDDV